MPRTRASILPSSNGSPSPRRSSWVATGRPPEPFRTSVLSSPPACRAVRLLVLDQFPRPDLLPSRLLADRLARDHHHRRVGGVLGMEVEGAGRIVMIEPGSLGPRPATGQEKRGL